MSYILDALKKSEQERGHGNIPGVQTVHSSSLNYNNNKTYWPYFLIAAVLLNLVAIIYFAFDKENKTTTDNVISADEDKQETVATPSSVNTQQITNNEPIVTDAIKQEPLLIPETINSKPENVRPQPAVPAINTAHTNDRNVIEFYDLPDSIKQELPTIVISAHVYSSNPLQRSIVINNNFLEEGEYVLDDMVLYEITRDGAVFSYHDILFHHGVVSTWQ